MLQPVDGWKALSIVVFPLIVTTGIALSAYLGSTSTHRLWFSCGVLFSAGVLLSGGLVHILPDANQMYAELRRSDARNDGEEEEDDDEEFPLPNVVFGLTFLFLLAVEVTAHRFAALFPNALGHHHHAHQHDESFTAEESSNLLCNEEEAAVEMTPQMGDHASCDCQRFITFSMLRRPGVALESKSTSLTTASSSSSIKTTTTTTTNLSSVHRPQPAPPPQNNGMHNSPPPSPRHRHGDTHNNNNNDSTRSHHKDQTSPWVAVLLLVVLSIHVLIENITLGATKTVDSIQEIFVAIVLHKGFSAFALGSGLVSAGFLNKGHKRQTFVWLCATFLAMDPLGIGIGWALSSALPPESYTEAILQAMLGGSFLFVSVIELIPGELEKIRNHGYSLTWVISSLFSGFAAMTLLGLWL